MNRTTSFNAIFNATEQDIKDARKEITFKRNQRAVASAIDSLEMQKMEAEEALEKKLGVVVTGSTIDVQEVLKLRATIQKATEQIDDLTVFQDEFFAIDEPAPKAKRKSATAAGVIKSDAESI